MLLTPCKHPCADNSNRRVVLTEVLPKKLPNVSEHAEDKKSANKDDVQPEQQEAPKNPGWLRNFAVETALFDCCIV